MNPKTIGKAINLLAKFAPHNAQKISFKIFTSPRPRKQKPEEVAFLAQANKDTITVLGDKVQMYTWGEGPKILFAHGWESNAGRWRSFVPLLLNKGYQVVAFDAPAHGASDGKRLHLMIYMNTIKAVLDKVGACHAFIGHSMGAGAAVLTFVEHKYLPRPKKLVLMGCFSEVSNIYKSYEQLLGLTPKLEQAFNKTIKKLSGNEVSFFAIAKQIEHLPEVKGLVIHDKQDKTIDIQEARNIANNWKHAQFVETDGAGHSLQSEEIFQLVIDFVTPE